MRTTRWHGMATAMRFALHAEATARTLRGAPMRCATSWYVAVVPGGMLVSARHTRCWKAVPRMSSGSSTGWVESSNEGDHRPHERIKRVVPADQFRPREAVLEVVDELFGVVAEVNRAYAVVRGGDEDRPE